MSLRHAILGFLAIRPLSGYDLKRAFDTSVRHFWTADQAAIYRALADLERDGLVTHERVAQTTRPDRKVHHLTDPGRGEFDRWLREAPQPAPRREPLLVKLFFAGPLEPRAMRAIFDAELAHVETELAALTSYAGVLAAQAEQRGAAGESTLLGPAITLTNGLELGIAYRDWLADLSQLAANGDLTLATLLARVRSRCDEAAPPRTIS